MVANATNTTVGSTTNWGTQYLGIYNDTQHIDPLIFVGTNGTNDTGVSATGWAMYGSRLGHIASDGSLKSTWYARKW